MNGFTFVSTTLPSKLGVQCQTSGRISKVAASSHHCMIQCPHQLRTWKQNKDNAAPASNGTKNSVIGSRHMLRNVAVQVTIDITKALCVKEVRFPCVAFDPFSAAIRLWAMSSAPWQTLYQISQGVPVGAQEDVRHLAQKERYVTLLHPIRTTRSGTGENAHLVCLMASLTPQRSCPSQRI